MCPSLFQSPRNQPNLLHCCCSPSTSPLYSWPQARREIACRSTFARPLRQRLPAASASRQTDHSLVYSSAHSLSELSFAARSHVRRPRSKPRSQSRPPHPAKQPTIVSSSLL